MNRASTLAFTTLSLALTAIAPAAAQQTDQKPPVDVSGDWEITAETPRGTMTRTVTFKQDGGSLTGSMETRMGSVPIQKGSLDGNQISFTLVFSRGDRSFEMTYRGTVEGDTGKGTFQTPRGDQVEWTARRLKPEES